MEFINAAWLVAQEDPSAEPPPGAPLGFGTERPWMYEAAPLAANPPGTHYEQIAHYVAGRGLPPGPYVLRLAVNPPGQSTVAAGAGGAAGPEGARPEPPRLQGRARSRLKTAAGRSPGSPAPTMTDQAEAGRQDSSSRRRSAAVIAAAFLIPFVVYVRTLAPTIVGGDTGELVTSAYVLASPYPTGYPLYMLWRGPSNCCPSAASPIGRTCSPRCAWRAPARFWRRRILQAGGSRPGALLAALTAGSRRWCGARRVVTDVYAPNALFVMAITAVFVRWQRTRSPRTLVWLAAVCGLALTHHRTSVLFAAPFLGTALLLHRPMSGRLVAKAAGAFALPLLLYLYLPLRAGAQPIANWGDPRTRKDFLAHVMGAQYLFYLSGLWPRELSPGRFLLQGLVWLPRIQYAGWGVGLALAGWVALAWRRRVTWVPLTVAATLVSLFGARYSVGNAPMYILPVYLVFAGLIAVGVETASRGLLAARTLSPGLRRGPSALVLIGLAVALPARLLAMNWTMEDHSNAWGGYDAGQLDPGGGRAPRPGGAERRRPDRGGQLPAGDREAAARRDRDLGGALGARLVRPVPGGEGLGGVGAEARRAFTIHKVEQVEEWGSWMARQVAQRYAQVRPTYCNISVTELPAGWTLLRGYILNRIVPGPPDLLAPEARDLREQTGRALASGVRLLRAEVLAGARGQRCRKPVPALPPGREPGSRSRWDRDSGTGCAGAGPGVSREVPVALRPGD